MPAAPSEARWRDLVKYARKTGLSRDAAEAYATLSWWGEHYGLRSPAIVSGKRSASRQRELQRAWDRGDRRGLVVRPADDSTHTDGTGWDVERVPHLAAYGQLAAYYPGVRWGGHFRTPDQVHFDIGRG